MVPSDDGKNPRRRISAQSFQNSPMLLPRVGLFPMQYYNSLKMKKSPPNGLERSWADIRIEAIRQVVYCHRNKYSDKETDGWTNIYRNNHPDMRMIRCRNREIYNSRNKYLNKSAFIRQFIEAGRERNLCCNYLVSDMRVLWSGCRPVRRVCDGSDQQNAGDGNPKARPSSDSHGLAYFHLRCLIPCRRK